MAGFNIRITATDSAAGKIQSVDEILKQFGTSIKNVTSAANTMNKSLDTSSKRMQSIATQSTKAAGGLGQVTTKMQQLTKIAGGTQTFAGFNSLLNIITLLRAEVGKASTALTQFRNVTTAISTSLNTSSASISSAVSAFERLSRVKGGGVSSLTQGFTAFQQQASAISGISASATRNIQTFRASIFGLSGAFKNAVGNMKKFAALFKDVERNSRSTGGGLNKSTKAIESFNKIMKNFDKVLKQVVSLLTKLVEEITVLTSVFKKAAASGQPLVNVVKNIGDNARTYLGPIENQVNATKRQGEAAKFSAAATTGYASALGGLYFSFIKVSTAGYAFLAALRGISRFLEQGITFEFEIAKAGAVAGATAGELNKMAEAAIQLGRVSLKTASDVAEAEYQLASLGFSVTAITDALQGIIVFAEGAAIATKESATAIGAAIKSFQLGFSEAGRVADVFQAAIRRSALVGEDFTRVMAGVGPVASLASQSIEETTAAIGVLKSRGLTARFAAAQLRHGSVRSL